MDTCSSSSIAMNSSCSFNVADRMNQFVLAISQVGQFFRIVVIVSAVRCNKRQHRNAGKMLHQGSDTPHDVALTRSHAVRWQGRMERI